MLISLKQRECFSLNDKLKNSQKELQRTTDTLTKTQDELQKSSSASSTTNDLVAEVSRLSALSERYEAERNSSRGDGEVLTTKINAWKSPPTMSVPNPGATCNVFPFH